ncbi:signal peptidase I [Amphibacillus sp. Q70]|uniref:signal peptidase I n=1 Tax=Amphibacillus sp. Q70 TaxID=3453416 RepID=UPI003F83E42F
MKEKEQSEWLSWIKAFIVALFLVWLVRAFIIIPIEVEGPSMSPALIDQDYLIVERLSYQLSNPKRFDIIVFHATEQKDYIKRVIGLPGETVEYKEDHLYVNNQLVEEPFLADHLNDNQHNSPFTNDFNLAEGIPGQHQVIPEGYYLVLGDNRQNSTDSRMIGLIPEEDIIGQARFIYWPFSRISSLN